LEPRISKAKYRIKQVCIEGFRGFTVPQTVDLAGENLFIFGLNGRGKSSIVEAIRWCLFGAPHGGDIEVRNTFYQAQECRVSLLLESSNQTISVQREFRPGHDRSRQIIRDVSGKELRARDALPQLARLGHHESAQVIFAAQHAAGRQVPADISEFKTVLCFYFRLEDVPKLLDALRRLREERSAEAEKLSKEIEQVEQGYRDKLREIQKLLTTLLENPPWGDGEIPTGLETGEKIKGFVVRIARLLNEEVPSEVGNTELLKRAQQWVEFGALRERADLEKRRDALKDQIHRADKLLVRARQAKLELDIVGEKFRQLQDKLRDLLNEETRERLHSSLETLERAKTEYEARGDVARRAKAVCEAHSTDICPACGTSFDPSALLQAIKGQCDIGQAFDSTVLERLGQRVAAVDAIHAALGNLGGQIESEKRTLEQLMRDLADLLGMSASAVDIPAVEAQLAELQADMQNLISQLKDAEAEKQRELRVIRELQQEQKYHDCRDQAKNMESMLTTGMRDVHDLLRDYHNLLARTDEVHSLVEQSFKEALDKAIPTLDEMFTDVYRGLTQQQSYDLVRVYHDPERTGALELRVASTRLPGQTFPPNVLNGQASKALHLVPYFVFSRFQPEIMAGISRPLRI
jgi:DNA repair exonuclease SbcCD ATPase subunit